MQVTGEEPRTKRAKRSSRAQLRPKAARRAAPRVNLRKIHGTRRMAMGGEHDDGDAYLDECLWYVLRRSAEDARCGLRMLRENCGVIDSQSCGCEEEGGRGWRRGGF